MLALLLTVSNQLSVSLLMSFQECYIRGIKQYIITMRLGLCAMSKFVEAKQQLLLAMIKKRDNETILAI